MRAWLTTGPKGLSRPALRAGGAVVFLLSTAALWAGCAGGQSGTESGYCGPEIASQPGEPDGSIMDVRPLDVDEDGGVEMEPDADATLVATEGNDVPDQCIVPEN